MQLLVSMIGVIRRLGEHSVFRLRKKNLVIIKQGRSGDIDASDISLYFNNGMDFEIPTMNKEQIKELQKSIQKSLKGLKMKNISQLNFDKLGCTITADELEVSL